MPLSSIRPLTFNSWKLFLEKLKFFPVILAKAKILTVVIAKKFGQF